MSIKDAEDVIAERNNPNLQAFRSTEFPAPLYTLSNKILHQIADK